MRVFSKIVLASIGSALLLAGCSGQGDSAVTGLKGDQASFAKELIRDSNCDPDIAAAMAPFESDYGECKMPQFLDLCGQENRTRGIELIAEIRNSERMGLNPWAIACARDADPVKAIEANCIAQNIAKADMCHCSVENLAAETDGDLRRLARVLAHDTVYAPGSQSSTLSQDTIAFQDADYAARNRYFKRIEACMKK